MIANFTSSLMPQGQANLFLQTIRGLFMFVMQLVFLLIRTMKNISCDMLQIDLTVGVCHLLNAFYTYARTLVLFNLHNRKRRKEIQNIKHT